LFQIFNISLEFETGIVANNGTADVSVDQYHRYKVSALIATKQEGSFVLPFLENKN